MGKIFVDLDVNILFDKGVFLVSGGHSPFIVFCVFSLLCLLSLLEFWLDLVSWRCSCPSFLLFFMLAFFLGFADSGIIRGFFTSTSTMKQKHKLSHLGLLDLPFVQGL